MYKGIWIVHDQFDFSYTSLNPRVFKEKYKSQLHGFWWAKNKPYFSSLAVGALFMELINILFLIILTSIINYRQSTWTPLNVSEITFESYFCPQMLLH